MNDPSKSIRNAYSIIQAFRSLDPDMPTNYAAAFCAVAAKPGLRVTEYADHLGLDRSVVSRILLEIGEKSRLRADGYGLIERRRDPTDFRAMRCFLTPKGQTLADKIAKVMLHKENPPTP